MTRTQILVTDYRPYNEADNISYVTTYKVASMLAKFVFLKCSKNENHAYFHEFDP